jgi:hypothetical protein
VPRTFAPFRVLKGLSAIQSDQSKSVPSIASESPFAVNHGRRCNGINNLFQDMLQTIAKLNAGLIAADKGWSGITNCTGAQVSINFSEDAARNSGPRVELVGLDLAAEVREFSPMHLLWVAAGDANPSRRDFAFYGAMSEDTLTTLHAAGFERFKAAIA